MFKKRITVSTLLKGQGNEREKKRLRNFQIFKRFKNCSWSTRHDNLMQQEIGLALGLGNEDINGTIGEI